MTSFDVFIVYLLMWRLCVLACALVSIVLGYRLFMSGFAAQEGGLEAGIGGNSLKLSNVAPGTFFALFGAAIIATLVWTSPAEINIPGEVMQASGQVETSPSWAENAWRIISMRRIGMWLLLLAVLGISIGTAQGQDFRNSYAIVVGVNDYSSLGLDLLTNAESDASAVAHYFRAQGYQVSLLLGPQSATKRKVQESVREIATQITESDRFVFFFAGHGKTQRTKDIDVAYLVVPGGRDRNDPVSLISTGDIWEYSRSLDQARHQLFIFDSCYAGLMGQFQRRAAGERPTYDSEKFLTRDLSVRRVRQYLQRGWRGPEGARRWPRELELVHLLPAEGTRAGHSESTPQRPHHLFRAGLLRAGGKCQP